MTTGTTDTISKAMTEAGSDLNGALGQKMHTLVKGAGYAVTDKPTGFGQGGNAPLTDPDQIFTKAMRAEHAWKGAIKQGYDDPHAVLKSWNPGFTSQFGSFMAANPQNAAMSNWVSALQGQLTEALGKNISLTSPLATGLVPFNLVAPSRLIYPVYTPIRNKMPRTQGQGTSYRTKVITGVSGSQTGSSGGNFVDIGIPEFQGGGSIAANWPLNIPGAGTQDSVDLNVPYKFSGLSESVSWLAQMAGQGFEDISALANLVLLQEFMMGEEAAYIAGSSGNLATPGTPTLTARSANATETGLSGVTTNVFAKVTAANYFGQTAASTGGSVAATNGQVVDVAIAPVAGAMTYNVYTTTGASAGTYFLQKTGVGGLNWTIQGALPTSGTAAPGADSGTGGTNRVEGIFATLSGRSITNTVYPSGWTGGYFTQTAASQLNSSVLNTALQGLWDGSGAFRADPAELVGEGGDIMRLSNDIVSTGNNQNYRLTIDQGQNNGIRAGAAVSEFVNPVTRSIVRIVVHPFWTQGSAALMSYTLPFAWSNVSNIWEANLVQDYISVSWPVIDATFRYSMYTYGNLVCNAPQYNGLIQGLQVSTRSGTTGTWA